MIRLGLDGESKTKIVNEYIKENGITNVFVLTDTLVGKLQIENAEVIHWPQIIKYKFFYRLLQEIGCSTLVVIDEILRTQDRNKLTYNCIRHFLNQTTHQIIFNTFPFIDTIADFMILVDFDTRSKLKRLPFSKELLIGMDIAGVRSVPSFSMINVPVDGKTAKEYSKTKQKLIDQIGIKDPHTIPRNLYLVSGKAKLSSIQSDKHYVGRNARFKIHNMSTYRDEEFKKSIVFEFCHNFIDFSDFLVLSGQRESKVLVADTKVDRWYFDQYVKWSERIGDAYDSIFK